MGYVPTRYSAVRRSCTFTLHSTSPTPVKDVSLAPGHRSSFVKRFSQIFQPENFRKTWLGQINCESLTARLACIRHAASVHPEPGSNSSQKRDKSRHLKFKNSDFRTDVDLHYSIFNERSKGQWLACLRTGTVLFSCVVLSSFADAQDRHLLSYLV